MRKLGLLLATLLPAAAVAAPTEPPKLIVAISVDQFSSDLFDEYRGQFRGGLARMAGGLAFRNGYQGHAATETCPGHSTILTGAFPAHTGIIANTWFDQSQARSDKSVYCAEDERVAGSSSTAYTVSPWHLKVTTLGERMKVANPTSRSVAVAGKDRAAIMMGGQRPDQRWYWDGKRYSTDLKGPVPRSAIAANGAVAQLLASPGEPLAPPPFCTAKSRSIDVAGKPFGDGRLARAAGDARAFRATPAFDGMTLALAAALVDELQLGKGTAPDLLAIGLSATDYVGHSFGTEGMEMCLQLHSLDRDLGDFFRLLDSRRIDYAVVLTADHGGLDIPERARDQGVAGAARVDPALSASEMGKVLAAKLGLAGPVLVGEASFGDIYLDRGLNGADRGRAMAAALIAYRAHPQVEAVFTREQLARTALPIASPDRWTLIERARASFDAARSGDFVVLLKRAITPIAKPSTGFIATHGSAWDYDRRVPVLFWRPGVTRVSSEAVVQTVDIMPTLAGWLGLRVDPKEVDGHCLAAVAGAACNIR